MVPLNKTQVLVFLLALLIIGYSHLVPTVFGLIGLLILIFSVWPSVMKHFGRNEPVKPSIRIKKNHPG